jgi:hypothetical protein
MHLRCLKKVSHYGTFSSIAHSQPSLSLASKDFSSKSAATAGVHLLLQNDPFACYSPSPSEGSATSRNTTNDGATTPHW